MLEAFKHFVAPIIRYTSLLIFSSTNIRSGYVFNHDEFSMAPIDEIKNELAFKDAKDENVPQLSYAELHIRKLNKKIPGFGTFVDIMFSPNIVRTTTIISLSLLILNPFGPAVAVVGMTLTASMLVLNTYFEAKSFKARQEGQIRNSILKELTNERDKLYLEIPTKPPFLDKQVLFQEILKTTAFSHENLAQRMAEWAKQTAPQYNSLNAALWGGGLRLPVVGFSLTMSILSFNPISIAISTFSAVLSTSTVARLSQRGAKVAAEFGESMKDMRQDLGLPNIPGHNGSQMYGHLLSEMKAINQAIEQFGRDYESNSKKLEKNGLLTDENLVKLFKQEYLDKAPVAELSVPVITFSSSLKGILFNGWTWSAIKTASCPQNPKFNSIFDDNAYNKLAKAQPSKEPNIDYFISKNTEVSQTSVGKNSRKNFVNKLDNNEIEKLVDRSIR